MKDKVFCIVAGRYLPYLGGVERYAFNVAKALIKAGNKVIVLTSCMNDMKNYEICEGIEVYRLPSLGLLKERFPVLLYNKKTRDMIKQLNKKRIDYVVVNSRYYPLCLFGVSYAKKRGIPSIVIEHNTGHFTVNNSFWDFAGHIYEHAITGLVKRKCNRFYGVSLACNKWLEHYKIAAKGVLYNAVDFKQIEELYTSNSEANIKEQIEYKKTDFVIAYIGRLIKEKGIEKLISAFRDIQSDYPDVKLCIAGDGEMLEEVEKQKTDKVYLLGRLEFCDVIQLLKYSKVYVLPTDYPEGLSTSILEAMACKTYVITTKMGGAKEVITDDSYGKIMQHNTPEEIRECIIEVLENEEKRQEVVGAAFSRVKQTYVWENTCAQLIDIFNK